MTQRAASSTGSDFGVTIKRILSTFWEVHPSIIVFLVCYLIYNTMTGFNMNSDSVPATLFPINILLNHSLSFDPLGPAAVYANSVGAYLNLHGHIYSLFPVVTPVLVTPVYAVSLFLSYLFDVPVTVYGYYVLGKSCAALIAALSCSIVFLVANDLFTRKTALLTTFTYAFATSTWSISSQALWQHGIEELFIILFIYIILENEKKYSPSYFVYLGVLSGLFLFNRPSDVILLVPVLYYLIKYYRAGIGYYLVSGFLAGLPFLVYNYMIFENPFGGYEDSIRYFSVGMDFFVNFAGTFFAPNFGLLIFAPVIILSFFGLLILLKSEKGPVNEVLIVFIPCIILDFAIYCLFGAWRGSIYAYGARYATVVVPILAIYIGIFYQEYFAGTFSGLWKKSITVLVILLLLSSVFIQFIGVFYYPLLKVKTMDEKRALDWNDSIISGSFNAGFGKDLQVTMYSFPPLPPLISYYYHAPGT